MSRVPEAIFREYDIRGVVDTDLTAEVAERIGLAFGELLGERGGRRAAIGWDARVSSPMLREAMSKGLEDAGIGTVDLGLCPTPLLYFALHHLEVDGGVMVTGSHNPPEFNGLKLCVGRDVLYGQGLQELRHRIEAAQGHRRRASERRTHHEIIPAYLEEISRQFASFRPGRATLKVVADSGNGTAGVVAPAALRLLGCEVVELYSEPDGRFPHHHPDPTLPENLKDLQQAVLASRADVGVAFDGDADRLGVVDDQGEIVWGDRLLILFARAILKERPGATVIGEVKCSYVLFDEVARLGGSGVMWKAGHSLIKAKMKETGALLGGEMSAHFFFADRYFGYDDGIYSACRLIELLVSHGRALSAILADLPVTHSTPEIRLDCPDAKKFAVVEEVKARLARRFPIVDVDGVRVIFEDGWGLVRASNTQPALVLRFEAKSPERLAEIRTLIEGELAGLV